MANKLKLGLVGADAAGRSWGAAAHIPALREIEQIELAALCTRRPESAAAAAEAFGVDRAYHDVDELVAQSDIDIISAVVNIPSHYEIVMPALHAGKHVYCEWPLGASLAETEEMAALEDANDVVTAIGLQGRHDPSLTHLKKLCDEGWFGDIHSVQMTFLVPSTPDRSSRVEYEREIHRGADLMTIIGGHTLAYIAYCFGSLAEVSARVATRVKKLRMADTGEMVDAEAADNVLLTGELTNGALLSYQLSAVPFHGDGWRMAVYGSEGTVIATAQGLPQITPIELVGAQGDEPLVELPVPERLRVVPASVPFGPPQNVAQAYVRMAEAIREGTPFAPSFQDALEVHRLLDAIQRSSDEGRGIRVV